MKPTRRRFTREFKLEVVRQLMSGRRLADVARELGVDAQVIRRWRDQVKVDAATAFPGNGRRARKEEELQRLRREVTQLRAERDFLKKRRCELLTVSRSGYYASRRRPASARALVNQQLVVDMRRIHREVDRTYGSPRMQPELVGAGFACGRHRVARLMRAAGIRAKQTNQYCVTTDSRHRFAIAPNHLDREFSTPAPNRVWMGDMTYIPTAEGWCFLAVLIDAFSRRVVGWALDTQLSASLPLTAWHQAVASRRPAPGLVHHSDRGTQ